MAAVRDVREDQCARAIRPLRSLPKRPEMSVDVAEQLIENYARLVEDLLDPRATPLRIEFAYSRLLGTRGTICRLCPVDAMSRLSRRGQRRWTGAEARLRDYLGRAPHLTEVVEIAQRVEAGWAESIERFVTTLTSRLSEAETGDKLGILKGIDTIGLHLAQRELFELSASFAIPLENAQAVKLRVRLMSLFLTLHRCGFYPAFPAIQSYRQTFRIHDPAAYPWWFVDCQLTERHLNWTYRRLPSSELAWRV